MPEKSEMNAIQKPNPAPVAETSRRAQLAAAINLIPKNAAQSLNGDGESDADEAPAAVPNDGGASTPPVVEGAPASTPAEPLSVEPPPAAPPAAPNPWDRVQALEAELLEAKKSLKKINDQISAPKDPPAQGPALPAITQADIAADPAGALKKLGISYQDLTERILQGGGPTAGDALSEAQRVRQEALDAVNAVRGEAAAIRNQLTRERLELSLGKAIETDPRFDVLKADPEAAVTAAISEMARHYQETGERLQESAVCARVASAWTERLKKLDTHGAVRRLLGLQNGTPAPVKPAAGTQNPPAGQPAKPASNGSTPATLTNDVHASSPPAAPRESTGSRALDRRALIQDSVRKLVPPNALSGEE